MKRPRIVRKDKRIYFGEGEHGWSCWDPTAELGDLARQECGHSLVYLAWTCPTTKDALEKLRLLRWALRNVKIQEPAPKKEGT